MILKMEAEQRTTERKSDLTQLRKSGFIPAVLYGPGTEPIKISLEKAAFMKLYKKGLNEIAFYEIRIAGKEYHTLVKERQIHPVSREILHVDFVVIPAHQLMDIDVPIKFVGTANGIKEGGIMDIVRRTLKIQCLPEDVPDDIEVDISNLNVGEALHVHQLPKGKWTIKDLPDTALVTIHTKKAEAEPVAAAEPKPEETPAETESK
jgi:large subunit ribosomal protein L25